MLLRLHQKKSSVDCQHPEIFAGFFCFFCVKCGLRGGVVFSGPLPEGWALVRAYKMKRKRKKLEKWEG